MKFNLGQALEILRQTPYTLTRMLDELSPDWTATIGDIENWAPYDVIGHLIHGEETDWIPRARIILEQRHGATFSPYDRLAQFQRSKNRSLADLLTEFAHLRNNNLETLARWELDETQLQLTAIHPELGVVTFEQLLATWVVHDLGHIRQIVTYMAARYAEHVGPWEAYLSILQTKKAPPV